ncbi:permease [Fibrobacterales bacterium]|nr:permease [Fibrobacterales bacterium]
MSYTILAINSALALGFYDLCKKRALNENAVWMVLFIAGLVGAVVMLPVIISGNASLTSSEHIQTAIKAVLVTSSWACTYNAIKFLPISISSPIRATSPLFTLFLAVAIIGERPTSLQWISILIILFGYFLLQLAGKKEGLNFRKNKWIFLMFLGTALGSVSSIYDKHLLQTANLNPLAMQAWFNVYSAALEGVLLICFYKREQVVVKRGGVIIAVGLLLVLSDYLYFSAMSQDGALVSVVSLLRRSSVLVSFFGGLILMKEKANKTKIAAVATIIIGIGNLY